MIFMKKKKKVALKKLMKSLRKQIMSTTQVFSKTMMENHQNTQDKIKPKKRLNTPHQ